MTKSSYRRQSHLLGVMNHLPDLKPSAAQMLCLMCVCSDFERPMVGITRSYMIAKTGLSLNAVKSGLRDLQEAGAIEPVFNTEGGRNKRKYWKLLKITPKGDQNEALFDYEDTCDAVKGTNLEPKGDQNVTKRGQQLGPHTPSSSISSEKAAPSRRETGDKAPDASGGLEDDTWRHLKAEHGPMEALAIMDRMRESGAFGPAEKNGGGGNVSL